MPELPEVETVRKWLEQLVVGKTIQSVDIFWSRIVENDNKQFCDALVGQMIKNIERRGKFLIFKLSDSDLISHLRMEGKYEYFEKNEPLEKHTHVVFHFTDESELRYLDVRKFGRMSLVRKDEALLEKNLRVLGPEPTAEEFLLRDFRCEIKEKHKAIKPLLLEQKLVVGLGNIYVDETLWQAKIHPERLSDSLKPKEITLLHETIIDVLGRAVEAGGSTIRTYINALGEAGKFQQELKVYGKTGAPCERCGTPIVKIKVAQRGTHFCPKCQKVRETGA